MAFWPRSATVALLFLSLLHCLPTFAQTPTTHTAPGYEDETTTITPRYLLMNPQGKAVAIDDFRGRFQLITFGFVSCPGVCPTTLQEFKQILQALGDRSKYLQVIFITVDPERDTPAILHEYTHAFDSRILALTGSPELIRRAAESFRVRYETVREPGAPKDAYTMNHTAGMFLLDGYGSFISRFAYATPTEQISERIGTLMTSVFRD